MAEDIRTVEDKALTEEERVAATKKVAEEVISLLDKDELTIEGLVEFLDGNELTIEGFVEFLGGNELTIEDIETTFTTLAQRLKSIAGIFARCSNTDNRDYIQQDRDNKAEQEEKEKLVLQLARKAFSEFPNERERIAALLKRELGETEYSNLISTLYFEKLNEADQVGTETTVAAVEGVADQAAQAAEAIKA
ncbi:hypothetical protein ACFL3C_05230 [Patescibacteria group bacterium]